MATKTPARVARTARAVAALYVYSTLTSDVRYQNHDTDGANDLPQPLGDGVLIKGGAGLVNDRIQTPYGVATGITEQEAEYLQQNPVFKLHQKNGFVQISADRMDPNDVAADMASRDASAPLVAQDLAADDQPIVGSATAE